MLCPSSPYPGVPGVRICCCWVSVLFTRRVQQGPKRPGRRSPHMNRRVFRLALPAILVATFAGIVAPQVAIADPISDKQAQASQLDAEINANATKLAALNEQINSAQNQLADANATIATADALVAAAQAKTKELRSEVAKRAAAVYAQSGSPRRRRSARRPERAGHLHAPEVQLARRAARQPDRRRPREVEGATRDPQVRCREGARGRADAVRRDPSAEGHAGRRPGRPGEDAVAGDG